MTEELSLNSHIWVILHHNRLNRQAVEDTEICGIPIKKGMECAVAPLALHYMPEYWPEPHKFDPER